MKWSFVTLTMLCTIIASQSFSQSVNIVPKPLKCEVNGSGKLTLFQDKTRVVVSGDELMKPAEIFAENIKPVLGVVAIEKGSKFIKNAINLAVNANLADEEYTLNIASSGVKIEGGSAKAVLYALQSLRQIIPAEKGVKSAKLPYVDIQDKPYFGYRGGMLDVCRHFSDVNEVKRYIDILALHKMNKFHWHLTEDQGWRIEIKKYPLLTKVGAKRAETKIGHYYSKDSFDGKPYGPFFYTHDQIRDVVKYAADRYIDVIPEIEMPGHALAALASYPLLGCKADEYKTATTWGIFDDVYCAGREGTFEFMEGVLAEVIELFPYKFIHIGGDECPKTVWKTCPDCQKRMKDNNLADENELQSYFMKRMEKWLNAHGKSIIGWDEILEGGVSQTATVMAWRGAKIGVEAAKKGNMVIMAPSSHCYLDYLQGPKESEPLSIGGNLPVEKVYSFDPYDGLGEGDKKFILGVQANLWREYIPHFGHVEYMLLPRLAAMAETGWAYDRKDYNDFIKRVEGIRGVYDINGYNYAKHIFQNK